MKSILEEFASGDIRTEPNHIENDSQYDRTLKTLCATEQKLLDLLDDTGQSLFNEFVDAQMENSRLYGVERFIHGYKLGVLMTMEVFNINRGE
ncbi:MAG: hypothetical protein FWE20_08985 [Defluviitaleaceae bacterium]|nr:hypothetical protein [Defluviitaleaceae bacterium]